jgi:hypothetical protein
MADNKAKDDEEGTKVEFEIEADGDVEVEVVDDTPEADRDREPMKEPPKEVTDEELAKYDESVRKRIQHFTKGYHEERRAKEAALREREEAVRVARAIVDENRRLKGSLGQNQLAMLEQAKRAVANDLESAKRKYKEAYEAGDADAIAAAQTELTTATIRAEKLTSIRPPSQQQENVVQQQQVAQQPARPPAPPVDPKAVDWQSRNRWFGQDEEMTSFALGIHNKLVRSGIDPRSDEYYERLDTRMREVFGGSEAAEANTQRTRSAVAPASRSTAPKKIVLTKTQVALAKKLGVPLELYAKKVAEEMRK